MSRRDIYLDLLDDSARDPSADLETVFKTLFSDVDGRIADLEGDVIEIDAIKSSILDTVLAYMAQKLEPEFDRVRVAADLGLLFEGRSFTELTVSTGQKTVFIREADRATFTATGFVGLMKTADPGVMMAGQRVSYDRASGMLVVDVDRIAGGGTAADWTIVPVSATDIITAAADAAASALAAQASAEDAEDHRDVTLGYRNEAETARTLASIARDDAVTAKDAAEAAADTAADHLAGVQALAEHYLGPAAANPTTRPGGGALEAGDLYWNTVASEMRVYSGTTWGAAYIPPTSAVASFNGRTGAVNPQSGDYPASMVPVSPAVAGASDAQAALAALDNAKAPKANPAFSGSSALFVADAGQNYSIYARSEVQRNALFGVYTGANIRWAWGKSVDNETGSNAGSNFQLYRYSDAGSYLGVSFQVIRSTGKVEITAAGATHAGFNIGQAGSDPSSLANGDLWMTGSGLKWRMAGVTCVAVTTDRTITAGTGLTGGGDLSTNRTLSFDATWGDARYSLAAHGHTNATAGASGFMSNTDKSKLDGIADNANLYVHPTTDGSRHVPANGTGNTNRVLKASGVAGTYTWEWVAFSEITGVPAALSAVGALTPVGDRIAYYTDGTTAALTALSSFIRTLLDDADAPTARNTLGAAATTHSHLIADLPEASAAQFRNKTAGRVLTSDKTWDAAAAVAVAYGATVTLDLAAGFNFEIGTLTGAVTLANPSNLKVGQSGFIRFQQDGTGGKTIAYGSNWLFSGGDPALSTGANAVDYLFYTVVGASAIVANLLKDVK